MPIQRPSFSMECAGLLFRLAFKALGEPPGPRGLFFYIRWATSLNDALAYSVSAKFQAKECRSHALMLALAVGSRKARAGFAR